MSDESIVTLREAMHDWRNVTALKSTMLLMNEQTRDYLDQHAGMLLVSDPSLLESIFGARITIRPNLPAKLIILANEQSNLMIDYSYRMLILP